MSWEDIEKTEVDKAAAKKANAVQKQKTVELAKAYHRCFETNEGQTVIADLTSRFIFDNGTSFDSSNVNYEAAYKNGEGGAVKFIINQITKAEIL